MIKPETAAELREKATKGPWSKGADNERIIKAHGNTYSGNGYVHHICRVTHNDDWRSSTESLANAKLIAAAPEMAETIIKQGEVIKAYNELIMAVATKWEGESRHETALRYIMQAEQSDDGCIAKQEIESNG